MIDAAETATTEDADTAGSGTYPRSPSRRPIGAGGLASLPACWAFVAVSATFVEAICRLGLRARLGVEHGFDASQWAWLALSALLFGYFEGYRGLHRRFAPQVLERLRSLDAQRGHTGRVRALLAPLQVVGLWDAEPRALAHAWASVAMIALAVLVVRSLPEPWRATVDAGVAIALSIGLLSLLARCWSWLKRRLKTAGA